MTSGRLTGISGSLEGLALARCSWVLRTQMNALLDCAAISSRPVLRIELPAGATPADLKPGARCSSASTDNR